MTRAEIQHSPLELWAISEGASTLIVDVEPFQTYRICGVVERLLIDPRDGTIDALVFDGTGEIVARWPVAGCDVHHRIKPGSHVSLEGLTTVVDGETILDRPRLTVIEVGGD